LRREGDAKTVDLLTAISMANNQVPAARVV